jgi:hypothetical protein
MADVTNATILYRGGIVWNGEQSSQLLPHNHRNAGYLLPFWRRRMQQLRYSRARASGPPGHIMAFGRTQPIRVMS